MSMDKAFASLTSGLLARKGAARPAMRPQVFQMGREGGLEDLGWNDMGDAAPAPRELIDVRLPSSLSGPAASMPVVRQQQEEIAREFAAPPQIADAAPAALPARPRRTRKAKAAKPAPAIAANPLPAGRRAAFTLRLDAERHLRLRLACAVEHRSAQQLVVAALDALLDGMPEVERLAASLPRAGKARVSEGEQP